MTARYDANGTSGFINIQRKKKIDHGLNVSVSSNIEIGKRLRQNQSTSISFHRNKISIYADYSFYNNKPCRTDGEYIQLREDTQQFRGIYNKGELEHNYC